MLIIGGVIVFFFGRASQGKYENVTPQQAESLIAAGNITIVDVREPFEYAEGHIPGAALIPLGTIQSKLASLNPEDSYLLVCRSGNRSGQAARILVAQGFKNVRNMTGGMLAWRGSVAK
ncbi:MAG: rhodanese-like domain-containing protein [Bacillota bacterium]|nr:rhodanese-like domain-containing protein [Bacillota bacterium]